VTTYGDMNNWHNVVGSGPFMLTDYVADDSATYIANPNYYGYDQRILRSSPLYQQDKYSDYPC